jgi:hypothetical protein
MLPWNRPGIWKLLRHIVMWRMVAFWLGSVFEVLKEIFAECKGFLLTEIRGNPSITMGASSRGWCDGQRFFDWLRP